ncbi:hypothetical protein C1O66_15750 [Paucibacter aquatile]|uniref:Pectinesterase n=1 Tax=Kinneretia aquatilis TaxID=2070761 RepID=A0A2N8KZF6_9BURK|nr:pectinesterase family protein [Paucibacter aquatile]PND38835.1 hypothetical protein C1O66_15750 [Paucibacter aquatile]
MGRSALALALALLAGSGQANPKLRPQLSEGQARLHTRAALLADWQPAAAPPLGELPAHFSVAADGSGSHRSLQAAIDALPSRNAASVAGAPTRYFIRLAPGRYVENVCIHDKPPLTIYGAGEEPGEVRLVAGRFAAQPREPGSASPCFPASSAARHGTAGSASVAVFSDEVTLRHLSIVNSALDGVRAGQGYPPEVGEGGGAQAVALMTRGDRIELDRVQLWGHQDTFYASRRREGESEGSGLSRVWVHDSLIAGDVDFIFGDARLLLERCTVLSRAGRRTPGEGGIVLAPSTAANEPLGFIVQDSRFLAEPGLAPGSVWLGRAWDQGVAKGEWRAGPSAPNGLAVVRESRIGAHIHARREGVWGPSTARRPHQTEGEAANRLLEHRNQDVP